MDAVEGLETEMQTDLGTAFPGHSSTKAQTVCTVSLKAHSRLVSTCCRSSDLSVQWCLISTGQQWKNKQV